MREIKCIVIEKSCLMQNENCRFIVVDFNEPKKEFRFESVLENSFIESSNFGLQNEA